MIKRIVVLLCGLGMLALLFMAVVHENMINESPIGAGLGLGMGLCLIYEAWRPSLFR